MFKFELLLEYFGKNPYILHLKDKYINELIVQNEQKLNISIEAYYDFFASNETYIITHGSNYNTLKTLIKDYNDSIPKHNLNYNNKKRKRLKVKIFYDNKVKKDHFLYFTSFYPSFSNIETNAYLERNFRYGGKKFAEIIDLNIGEKSAKYVLSQFGITDKNINSIKIDGLLGETEKCFHFSYKNKHFFTYKEDTEHPIEKQWLSIPLDVKKLNKMNKNPEWEKNKYEFYNHQIEGIKFLLWVKKGFIFDKTGIGKSNQALVASILNGGKRTLILTIKEDLKKWGELVEDFGQKSEVINNLYEKSDTILEANYHILNYDIVKKFSNSKETNFNIFEFTYDTIILDECHKIRNSQSKKSDILNKLFKMPYIKNIYGLSATPFETNEQLLGLYETLNIDPDNLIPTSYDNFNSSYKKTCDFKLNYCEGIPMKINKQGGNGDKRNIIKLGASTNSIELAQRIKYTYLCRTDSEVEGFPEKKVTLLNLQLDLETKRKYEAYRDELIEMYTEMFKNKTEDGEQGINAELPATTKLRQFLAEYATEQTSKFVRTLIENNNEKVIIFTHFNDEFKILCEKLSDVAVWVNANPQLRWRKKSNNEIVKEFKENSEYQVIIGNASTLGTAHNIPQAGHCILNSPNWNSGEHDQMMGRNWRLDRKGTVHAWFWNYEDTKTEHIFNKSTSKGLNLKILLMNIYK